MSMTRRDFTAVASCLAQHADDLNRRGVSSNSVDVIAFALADAFATTNAAFDRQRFLLASHVSAHYLPTAD